MLCVDRQRAGHGDVAEAMELAHTQAAQLVLLLSPQTGRSTQALLLAHALMDGIDGMRALHVRVVTGQIAR